MPPWADSRAVTSRPERGFGTSRRPFFDFDFGGTVENQYKFEMRKARLCLPFFTSAAAAIAFKEVFAPSSNSFGGFEYFIRISGIGGSFSSEFTARLLIAWLIRCRAGEKVSSIGAYSAGLLSNVSWYNFRTMQSLPTLLHLRRKWTGP